MPSSTGGQSIIDFCEGELEDEDEGVENELLGKYFLDILVYYILWGHTFFVLKNENSSYTATEDGKVKVKAMYVLKLSDLYPTALVHK